MFGMIRFYRRNKMLYEVLDEFRDSTDEAAFLNKRLMIEINGRRLDTELRLYELCFLNSPNIGYAVIYDSKRGLSLLMDRYERDGRAECHPFEDGKVSIEACHKRRKQIITFSIEDAG